MDYKWNKNKTEQNQEQNINPKNQKQTINKNRK